MRVRYTLRAQADLDAIYTYLDTRAPAAAQSVKDMIERRIALLAEFPRVAPETDQPGVYELTLSDIRIMFTTKSVATKYGSCTSAMRGASHGSVPTVDFCRALARSGSNIYAIQS